MPRPRKKLQDEKAYHLINHKPVYGVYLERDMDSHQQQHAGRSRLLTEPLEAGRLNELPTDPDLHTRGFLGETSAWLAYVDYGRDNYYPRMNPPSSRLTPDAVKFHGWPTNDPYGDIPPREDIYSFIKWPSHHIHIHIGPNKISVLTKNAVTHQLRERLKQWEKEYQYNRLTRIMTRSPDEKPAEHYRRYTYKALRDMGLQWATKRSKRRKQWAEDVRALGVCVEEVKRKQAGRLITWQPAEE